jgi:xanthine dehydrogenase YagR molybdenum-binding subunit
VAKGKIKHIDASGALGLPGVHKVFTHENVPKLAGDSTNYHEEVTLAASPFRPLYDDKVRYSGQPVALVVAESFELAQYAASLVRIEYVPQKYGIARDVEHEVYKSNVGKSVAMAAGPRGRPEAAMSKAVVPIDARFRAPVEHHNPMEPFATTVVRSEDGRLTVYDKTQGVQNVQSYICGVFGCSKDALRVVSPHGGVVYSLGLRPQHQVFLAVLAARELKRSVRLSLTRQQILDFCFLNTGPQRGSVSRSMRRPHTESHVGQD